MLTSRKRPMRVIGWYHSHPHITVWPSHVGKFMWLNVFYTRLTLRQCWLVVETFEPPAGGTLWLAFACLLAFEYTVRPFFLLSYQAFSFSILSLTSIGFGQYSTWWLLTGLPWISPFLCLIAAWLHQLLRHQLPSSSVLLLMSLLVTKIDSYMYKQATKAMPA